MSKLLFVRHGQVESNNPQKFWGRTDIKLSPAGIRQAELLRDRLAGEPIDLAYASTLSRAISTAAIIAAPHILKVTSTPDIDEMNFGEFEGLSFDQISQRDPDTAKLLMDWQISPRFPGGESLDEINIRLKRFLATLDLNDKKTILIVAHAGPLRMMITHLLGLDIVNWRKLRIDMGSLSIVQTYPPGIAILSLLNDVGHYGGKLHEE